VHSQVGDVNIILVVYAVTYQDHINVYLPFMPAFTVLSAKLIFD
jgi:hypothetical protein